MGYLVKSGGLQGYLVSKDMVEKYDIKSLDDLKRDEVKKPLMPTETEKPILWPARPAGVAKKS